MVETQLTAIPTIIDGPLLEVEEDLEEEDTQEEVIVEEGLEEGVKEETVEGEEDVVDPWASQKLDWNKEKFIVNYVLKYMNNFEYFFLFLTAMKWGV